MCQRRPNCFFKNRSQNQILMYLLTVPNVCHTWCPGFYWGPRIGTKFHSSPALITLTLNQALCYYSKWMRSKRENETIVIYSLPDAPMQPYELLFINITTISSTTTSLWPLLFYIVPINVGSPEGGSHEGVPDQWRTHEYGNFHVRKNLFFFFPPFFPSCFFLKKLPEGFPNRWRTLGV